MNPTDSAEARIRAYHQRTKHAFGRYAASPSFLDWETQPNPLRRFAGAAITELPLLADLNAPATPTGRRLSQLPLPLYADLFRPGNIPPQPLSLDSLAAVLELSFGLAAWKQYGTDRWALRCNPSSGNLHPTEAYVITGGIAGLSDGVHHYASHEHALEQRAAFAVPFDGVLLGLSAIHWREAWKYGERAFRYCQHDAGHAFGALSYAAATLGWRVRLLAAWGDDDIAAVLGLEREDDFAGAEHEAADLICWIDTGATDAVPPDIDGLIAAARAAVWHGKANALSRRHEFDWPIIEQASAAAHKPRTPPMVTAPAPPVAELPPTRCELPAAQLIKQRRSAQAFDGLTSIPAKTLFRLLAATLPRPGLPPFAGWPWSAKVDLLLFVHRVQGLPPGLYLFNRNPEARVALQAAMRKDWRWQAAEGCPADLPLLHLLRADGRQAAKTLSCQQDIAADSAFSLGMLALFDVELLHAPWAYRRLFWECGLIGQALYLEAEAAGVRGTGIGCFFDDPVHDLLELRDSAFQSLYHFTIGGPLNDERLQTLPAYAHLMAH